MRTLRIALGVAVLTGISGVAAADPTDYQTATFDNGDTRFYTASNEGVDWDVGSFKGECGFTMKVMGISADALQIGPHLRPHSLLCGDWNAFGGLRIERLNRGTNEQMRRNQYRDDRGDYSTGTWDSAPNTLAECKADEAVTGVSQDGAGHLVKILCSSGRGKTSANNNDCQALVFSNVSDNRSSFDDGDWAPGYSKNQCRPDQYVKGVSRAPNGDIHAILCCGYSIAID